MIRKLIDKYLTAQKANNLDFEFIESSKALANVIADDKRSDTVLIQLEPFALGRYTSTKPYADVQTINIYFMKQIEFQDGNESEKIATVDMLKAEYVDKFVSMARKAQATNFSYVTPPSRYDFNEVGVLLQFEIPRYLC